MRQVYVLRHAPKDNESGELTEEGRVKAKAVGSKLPTFHKIIASPSARTQETAELLTGTQPHIDVRAGHFVGTAEQSELLKLQAQLHPLGFTGALFDTPEVQVDVRKVAENFVVLLRETLENLPDHERALIVSHDITIVPAEQLLRGQNMGTSVKTFAPLSGYIVNEKGEVEFYSL